MFCNKCGASVSDGAAFCPECGTPTATNPGAPDLTAPTQNDAFQSVPSQNDAFKSTPSQNSAYQSVPSQNDAFQSAPVAGVNVMDAPTDPAFAPNPEAPKSKKGLIIGIVSAVVAVVVAAGVAVWLLFFNSNTDGCNEAVEAYLDAIADKKEPDASAYISDMYFGGKFGSFYNGEDAEDINELYAGTLLNSASVGRSLGYGSGVSVEKGDLWKNRVLSSSLKPFYREMERKYGDDWKLDYEITDTEKMSGSDKDDLQDKWEDVIDNYNKLADELDDDDSKDVEEFVEKLEELEVDSAYEVIVNVEIKGDKDSYEEEVEFSVAEIGDEWVILEGPSFEDFVE